mmetsp:Transcript_56210/g.111715  ORF Transcript_56210/g.111715 Transcript_56210/m.111715 type:complete len:251 (+) Transcript_56210:1611-2363(+)
MCLRRARATCLLRPRAMCLHQPRTTRLRQPRVMCQRQPAAMYLHQPEPSKQLQKWWLQHHDSQKLCRHRMQCRRQRSRTLCHGRRHMWSDHRRMRPAWMSGRRRGHLHRHPPKRFLCRLLRRWRRHRSQRLWSRLHGNTEAGHHSRQGRNGQNGTAGIAGIAGAMMVMIMMIMMMASTKLMNRHQQSRGPLRKNKSLWRRISHPWRRCRRPLRQCRSPHGQQLRLLHRQRLQTQCWKRRCRRLRLLRCHH